MNPLIRIAIIIVVCYLALVLFVFFRQKNMVYYPTGTIVATPAAIQLKYKEIVFTTSDRVQLYGWFVGDESKKEVILFCHGNGGNISHRLDTLSIFNQLGLRTFIFDYRGYGKSAGETTEEGTYLDVQAAWDYLTKHQKIPPQRIILYGRSLGGAVIANLAAKVKPRQLIIESSFTSVPKLGAGLYPYLPVRLLSRFSYDTQAILPKITVPVLVIHSPGDDIIPYHHGKSLFTAASEPKAFLEITGTHNSGFLNSGDTYIKGLRAFLEKYNPPLK